MAKGDIYTIDLPYFITLRNKRHSLNLNTYRNSHYQLTNKLKKEFKELVMDDIIEKLPENMQRIKVHYKIYYENLRKFDLDNVTAIIAKFSLDALTELGRIPDDNYDIVQQITSTFGGVDRDNPRVEMRIKEI